MKLKIGRRWSIQRTRPLCLRGASMAGSLKLLDRVEVEVGARRVLADAHDGVAHEGVGRHGQIVGRRHALEDAAREVVARAVARAEIPALPAGSEIAAGLRVETGNAAQ